METLILEDNEVDRDGALALAAALDDNPSVRSVQSLPPCVVAGFVAGGVVGVAVVVVVGLGVGANDDDDAVVCVVV